MMDVSNLPITIDYRLLDEIEINLIQWIAAAQQEEERIPVPSHPTNKVSVHRGEKLSAADTTLAELKRRTAELERELIAQEVELRRWFEDLGHIRTILPGLRTSLETRTTTEGVGSTVPS